MNSQWFKSKRNAMRVTLPDTDVYAGKKLTGRLLDKKTVVEKGTGRIVVRFSLYGNASSDSVSLAVYPMHGKFLINSTGRATGRDYHRPSTAMEEAMTVAGIRMTGDVCNDDSEPIDWNRFVRIGGCGDHSIDDALLAIAYAAGARSVVVV